MTYSEYTDIQWDLSALHDKAVMKAWPHEKISPYNRREIAAYQAGVMAAKSVLSNYNPTKKKDRRNI